jgi:hypothetical protein
MSMGMICIKYKTQDRVGDVIVIPFKGCCKLETLETLYQSGNQIVRSTISIDGHLYKSSRASFGPTALAAICDASAVGWGLVDLVPLQGEPELVTED